jgi:hypothetical protein
MDVACFIGFVRMRRNAPLPSQIVDWLLKNRWLLDKNQDIESLSNIPFPVESWDTFHELFAWDHRADCEVVIKSTALEDTVFINEQDNVLHVIVDNNSQKIQLPMGEIQLAELVSSLNEELVNIVVQVQLNHGNNHIVFKREELEYPGGITISANASLGIPELTSNSNQYTDSYLGAAVRAFFLHGGRKCYVVRIDDPLVLSASEKEKINHLSRLLYGVEAWQGCKELSSIINAYLPSQNTPNTPQEVWHGIEHLFGLNDVSFVSFPDLPDLLSNPVTHRAELIASPGESEQFVECAGTIIQPGSIDTQRWAAPCCNEIGYKVWVKIIRHLTNFISKHCREVQLIASLPIPDEAFARELPNFIDERFTEESISQPPNLQGSAFLQLVYPWIKTPEGRALPGEAVVPESILIGMLAANSLTNGTFTNAAGQLVHRALGFVPRFYDSRRFETGLSRKISLFSQTPKGITLYSDVTTSSNIAYQQAHINRITALILRATRALGESLTFESSSPRLWQQLQRNLYTILYSLYEAGGLRGPTADEAFEVTCNRSTMSDSDIDSGRIIAEVVFQPAASIERIFVRFAIQNGSVLDFQRAA